MEAEKLKVSKTGSEELRMFLDGRIDGNTSENIQKQAVEAIENEEIESFVFDVNGVTYVSSAGLRMFSGISGLCRSKGIDYCLDGLREDMMRMFQLTGYANIFKINVRQDV